MKTNERKDVTKMTHEEYAEYRTKQRDKLIEGYDDLIAAGDAAVFGAIGVLVLLVILGVSVLIAAWWYG